MNNSNLEQPFKGEQDPQIYSEIRNFLQALNSGGGATWKL